jgi:hypothetical protein
MGLYDTATFELLTKKQLEQEHLLWVLQNDNAHKRNPFESWEIPARLLYNAADWLYNKDYLDYKTIEYDDNGLIWLQHSKNKPRTCLGWATLEYRY